MFHQYPRGLYWRGHERDGSASSPRLNDWQNIRVRASGATGVFDHRGGGQGISLRNCSSPVLSNVTFGGNAGGGVYNSAHASGNARQQDGRQRLLPAECRHSRRLRPQEHRSLGSYLGQSRRGRHANPRTWFKIDDGSYLGAKCLVPEGVTIDPNWQCVGVTRISPCEKVSRNSSAC